MHVILINSSAIWSNHGSGEIFRTRPDRSCAHPAPFAMGIGSLPGVKGWGMALPTQPHLAPTLEKE